LLWGIDYLTHDIPVFTFAPSESYESWLKYFGYLKTIQYPMKLLVCDDNENIKAACRYLFPQVIVQTCQVHFLENIRKQLQVRTDPTYELFMHDLKQELFSRKITRTDFEKRAFKLFKKYEHDRVAVQVLLRIHAYTEELTAATRVTHGPCTTNIIESYNSHLEARLKSIKGFKAFHSAYRWLNAYILRRRFRPFTDCGKKFRHLNGTAAIQHTVQKGKTLPKLF
jgi:transposase-like protein